MATDPSYNAVGAQSSDGLVLLLLDMHHHGYTIAGTLAAFLFPDLPAVVHQLITAPTIAEFWMIAYLVTRGVRAPRPDQPAPSAVRA